MALTLPPPSCPSGTILPFPRASPASLPAILLAPRTGSASLRAILPTSGAVALILISMLLTYIAGLIPSRFAARRNPVEALRTE